MADLPPRESYYLSSAIRRAKKYMDEHEFDCVRYVFKGYPIVQYRTSSRDDVETIFNLGLECLNGRLVIQKLEEQLATLRNGQETQKEKSSTAELPAKLPETASTSGQV